MIRRLARIAHRFTAAAADLPANTALRSAGVLGALSGTAARPASRAPCRYRSLQALAARVGERCGPAAIALLLAALPAWAAGDGGSPFGEGLKGFGLGGGEPQFLPAEEAFRVLAEPAGPKAVRLEWDVAEGYYLYRDKFGFEAEGNTLAAPPELPVTEVKQDPYFGEVPVIKGGFETRLELASRPAGPQPLSLKFQGCAEDGICYPPITRQVSVDFSQAAAGGTSPGPGGAAPAAGLSESDGIAASLAGGSALAVLASFFGFGLLLAFTPCVLPMIPILSGIIVGEGSRLTARRGLVLSLVYVLAMAAMYAVAGVLAGLFGQNLQVLMQHPAVLVAFALVFVALAAAMFGAFELQVPSAVQSRLGALANAQGGGRLGGVAVMGVLSAVIVGPCVAPPLAGALLYIAQTGDAALGGAALFVLALGMGAPLVLLGASAGRWLPRAGVWMESVKRLFGLVLLGVAIWLLERIIPGPLALGLWGLLFIVAAILMGALDRTEQLAGVWGRLGKGLGVALLVYGIAAVVGAAAGGRDLARPLAPLAMGGPGAAAEAAAAPAFTAIAGPDELEAELAAAGRSGRVAMLDFYADWCVECKHMEDKTFVDPRVRERLAELHVLQADVTANDVADRALLAAHELFGPPAILFFDPQGRELRQFRLVGYLGPEAFRAHLDKVRLALR